MKKNLFKFLVASVMALSFLAFGVRVLALIGERIGLDLGAKSTNVYAATSSSSLNGWVQDDGDWYYYVNGTAATGWKQINGYWYYFVSDGRMVEGTTLEIGGNTYIFEENGHCRIGWYHGTNDYWYYYNNDGTRANGLQVIDGKTYYFSSYRMKSDAFFEIDDVFYYAHEDGHVETGTTWIYSRDKWYYFIDGTMAIGWQKIDGKWYYFYENYVMGHGAMNTLSTYQILNTRYFFNADGSLVSNEGWRRSREVNAWYYVTSEGKIMRGWFMVDGKWYYNVWNRNDIPICVYNVDYDDSRVWVSGCLRNMWAKIDGRWYHFGDDCAMDMDDRNLVGLINLQEGMTNSFPDQYLYYSEPGVIYYGWKMIDGEWYYFSNLGDGGLRARNETLFIDGRYYHFDENGHIVTGWFTLRDDVLYLTVNGSAKGWMEIDGNWYYFGEGTKMVRGGFERIKGRTYYFDDNGVMQTGWIEVDGQWYFMNDSGAMMTNAWAKYNNRWAYLGSDGISVTGFQTINGSRYYFNSNGYMLTGWQCVANNWYYLGDDGILQTGWIQTGTRWSYTDTDGACVYGWQSIDGKWYYFDASGYMVTGWKKISNQWYYFDDNGIMQHDTWIGDDHLGSNGAYDYSR